MKTQWVFYNVILLQTMYTNAWIIWNVWWWRHTTYLVIQTAKFQWSDRVCVDAHTCLCAHKTKVNLISCVWSSLFSMLFTKLKAISSMSSVSIHLTTIQWKHNKELCRIHFYIWISSVHMIVWNVKHPIEPKIEHSSNAKMKFAMAYKATYIYIFILNVLTYPVFLSVEIPLEIKIIIFHKIESWKMNLLLFASFMTILEYKIWIKYFFLVAKH